MVKRSTTFALALATVLSGSLAAYAQTEQPSVHHRYHHHYPPHHTIHHHYVARKHTPGAPPIVQQRQAEPPVTNPMFQPYANPGEGDDNGLSRDPDDCMKGCIGGNPG